MHEMWSAVYKYADSIVNHGALLFQLSENGLSNRKIAQLMGVNCRRIDRCLHQIRNGLREQLVEFSETAAGHEAALGKAAFERLNAFGGLR